MIEELSYILSRFESPERKSILLNALNVLYENNQHAQDFELKNILMTAEQIGYDQMMLSIDGVIRKALDVTLREFGIVYKEDTAISLLTNILAGLNLLESYLDHDLIISKVMDEPDGTDTLCDLLTLVTDRTWAEYAEAIVEVPNALLERLSDVHQKAIDAEEGNLEEIVEELEEDKHHAMIRDRLKEYLKKVEGETLIARLIASGYRLGSSMKHYIDGCSEALEEFSPKDPKRACQEMLAIALATDAYTNDIKRVVNDWLENVYHDMNFITQVEIVLTDEIRKVQANG